MLKILHTADLHLDSPLASLAMRDPALRHRVGTASRQVLEHIVTFCIKEGVAALLIAGDLYDRAERSMKTAAFLARQMERLNGRGIQVFYIKGNHDAENPAAGEMQLPSNVHVFDGHGGKVQLKDTDVWVHGVSFGQAHAPHSLLPKFGDPVPGAINVAMLHTSLAGAAGHDVYAPCSVSELAAKGFDYWALGHVHKRQVHSESPWVVMPGTPQGRDIGEEGRKSATLLTIDNGAILVSEVPTSHVEFRRIDCDITGHADDSAVERYLSELLRKEIAALQSGFGIYRLRLIGTSPIGWQLRRDRDRWRETAALVAGEDDRAFIESLAIDIAESAAPAGLADAAGELQAMMDQIAQEEGFRQEAREEVWRMLEALPRERRMTLAPDEAGEEALVRAIAASAAKAMGARIRGASGGGR
jgi:exonuclease SbcD